MIMRFDKLNKLIMPSIVLCNPNGKELEAIDGTIYNTELTLRYNTMSEFTFTVPSVLDDESLNIWYNLVTAKRLIKVENIGVFMITGVNKTSDGVQDIKEVSTFSLEVDLNYKKVNLLSGTYKFYDYINPLNENTLVGKIMSMPQMRGWTIGIVSSSLWNKTRAYEISDQTIYNFFMTTVEEAMECVFEYNTFTKTIDILDMEDAIKKTDIFLSFDNLLQNVKVEEMSDELVTVMQCYGGGDLTIRGVNPLGDTSIYNFDYFLKDGEDWISDALKTAIINWQDLQKQVQPTYANLLVQYRAKNNELIVKKGELVDLESVYNAIEGNLSIEMDAGGNTSTLATQLLNQQVLIDAKKSEINTTTQQVTAIQNQLTAIQNQVKLTNNFTVEQLKELSCYMVESTYTNDAFIQTSIMSAVEIQDMQQELYDFSKKVLEKLSQPRYSFSIESTNFLFLKEFQPFTQQLELGCELCIDMDNDLFSYPVLLEMSFSFDDPTSFNMTFGNRLRLDKNDFRFAELFGESVNAGASVTINQGAWSEFNKNYQDEVSQFMNNELVAAQKNIVNASNQQIKIGEWGMLAQKQLESGGYSPKKAWWINNGLYFTKDNWNTVSAAFGEFENGGYGILADVIGGKLLIGNALKIEATKSDGTGLFFRVDENGVYMKNADIVMANGNTLDTNLTNVAIQAKNANDKIVNVTTTGGLLDTNKMYGSILAGNNNIYALDNTNLKAMVINSNGILIANSLKSNGEWDWKTAISADGIIADQIKSGGTISGCNAFFGETSGNGLIIDSHGVLDLKTNNNTVAHIWKTDTEGGYFILGNPSGQEVFRVQSVATENAVAMNFQRFTRITNWGRGIEVECSYVDISGSLYVNGDLSVTGEKPAIVPTQHYGVRTLYCEEADKSYFSTKGMGETVNQECIIELDPIFVETIELNSTNPYIVYLTSYSDARVWVDKIDDYSFVVKSDKDTKFSYDLKAIRITFGNKYLEEKTNLSKKQLASIQKAGIERMKKES